MRALLILLPLAMAATPAVAQSPAETIQLPPELTDPAIADRLSNAMDSLTKIMLDLKVGEVQAALEGRQATPAEKRLTVRDLGKIDDADLHRRMAGMKPRIRESMKAFQTALPEMMRSLEQAGRSLERVTANIPDPTYPKR